MVTIVKRVLGAVLALVGLALVVVGSWFATQLGSSGTAEFTVSPDADSPLLIQPDVLNRVDADVVLTATPEDGGSIWMALANPSDATAVVGSARHLEVTGVEVRDWALTTTTRGSGEAPALGEADLWRQQDSADGPVQLTVLQSEAPETVVVTSDGAPLKSLTMTVVDKRWFVEAVVAALVGLFLLALGTILLWPHRRRRPEAAGAAEGETPTTTEDAGDDTTPEDTTTEEVAR